MEIAFLPRRLLVRCAPEGAAQVHLNILVSTLLLLGGAVWLSYAPRLLAHIPHVCLARRLLGIPCPGCGVTGAMLALARGHLARAWHANPAGLPLLAFCLLQIPLRLWLIIAKPTASRLPAWSRWGGGVVVGCLLAVWVFRLLNLQ